MSDNPYESSPEANYRPEHKTFAAGWISTCAQVAIVGGIIASPIIYHYYARAKATALAKLRRPIVQAIVNFRAETGLLPFELDDLSARYEVEIPEPAYYSNDGILEVRQGSVSASYIFGEEFEGWTSDGPLPLPVVTPTVEVVTGQSRVAAALAEYDRRIGVYENDRWHRSRKLALLASLGKEVDVYRECLAALEQHPDWWRAQFGAATYAPQQERDSREEAFRQWADRSPGFVHYWLLAKYHRNLGRHVNACEALGKAAKYPLEQVDDDAGTVPHALAFDAATYACQQKRPELVLALCDAWADARGVYDHESPNLPAFRAAALLSLGRLAEARAECNKVLEESRQRVIWAGNLNALRSAIERRNRSFIYNPGSPYDGFMDWSPFPMPEFFDTTEQESHGESRSENAGDGSGNLEHSTSKSGLTLFTGPSELAASSH